MLFKNAELYNVSEIFQNDDGSTGWLRVPEWVDCDLSDGGKRQNRGATGVELRFVLRSGEAKIRMSADSNDFTNVFHVYRGAIQGSWDDHELNKSVREDAADYIIRRSPDAGDFARVARLSRHPFDPEVIRVIFDRGIFHIFDIEGDIEPPSAAQTPRDTILFYGSSITHGSNSIDQSHSFVSRVGARLGMDVRNLGFAGSCAMEPSMAKFIADEGVAGKYSAAVLELGINVMWWEESLIYERVENILREVAGRNPEKPMVVISPFYAFEDLRGGGRLASWRKIIREIVEKLNYPNVRYVDGLSLLGAPSLLSADLVHPNIDGVDAIADGLTKILGSML